MSQFFFFKFIPRDSPFTVNQQDVLKGQYPEMNNFFEGPKNQISTFCISAHDFKFFCILKVDGKEKWGGWGKLQ